MKVYANILAALLIAWPQLINDSFSAMSGTGFVQRNLLFRSLYVNLHTWVTLFFGQRTFVPLLLLGPPFYPVILFLSTTLLAGMTGISLDT
jgi:hypothetical protein